MRPFYSQKKERERKKKAQTQRQKRRISQSQRADTKIGNLRPRPYGAVFLPCTGKGEEAGGGKTKKRRKVVRRGAVVGFCVQTTKNKNEYKTVQINETRQSSEGDWLEKKDERKNPKNRKK